MTAPTSASPAATSSPSPLSSEWIRLERTIEKIGKLKKESKRRVTWVIQHQPTGALCRIALVWSIKTGKYSIYCNDREHVFDRHKGSSFIDRSFTLNGSSSDGDDDAFPKAVKDTRVRVVAARSVPAKRPFVQYDLVVNGIKFRSLPGDCVLADEGLPSLVDVVFVQSSS